jgi:hypothetical protein
MLYDHALNTLQHDVDVSFLDGGSGMQPNHCQPKIRGRSALQQVLVSTIKVGPMLIHVHELPVALKLSPDKGVHNRQFERVNVTPRQQCLRPNISALERCSDDLVLPYSIACTCTRVHRGTYGPPNPCVFFPQIYTPFSNEYNGACISLKPFLFPGQLCRTENTWPLKRPCL